MSALLDILHRDCDAEGARIAEEADSAACGLAPLVKPVWSQVAVHTALYAELAYAIEAGMTKRPCWVPGFKDHSLPYMPAADIVADSFAGKDDATLHELLELWSAAIKSTDPKVADLGRKLLHKVCRAHADFHEGDAA